MDGNIHTYKACLVAKGFTQTYRVDYEETFSPIADIKAIRILIAISAYYDYKIWQMDVKTAFLNGRLNEDVYMVQPEGFVNPKHHGRVCKLQRSIYGLKQAFRSWNKRFDEEIKKYGFAQNPNEPCVYKRASGSNIVFLILYVDDILLMGNNIPMLQDVKSWLGKSFTMKDLGERFRMDTSRRGTIPMQPNVDLSNTQGPSTPAEVKRMKRIRYASVVGSIMYAMRCTRPDIAFSQNLTSRYQQNPGESHWTPVKNILKYLRNTKDMFLIYGGDSTTELGVTCYTDASAVDWKSSKQSTTAMSSMKANYIAATEAAMEAIWIRKFISGLSVVPCIDRPMDMYCDNTGAITIADEPGVQKPRSSCSYSLVKLNASIKLMLFPFSIEGAARIWLEKEPPHSILTWEDLVSMFINQFFPPSKTTNLYNEITNFQQRFDESFCEACDHFKDLLSVGGNLLTKTPKDALTIIKNKSKFFTSQNRPVVAKVSTNTSTSGLSPDVAALTDAVKALLLKNTTPPPASVKAVEESCVTCGGPHPYYHCLATDDNSSGYQDNIQAYVSAAAVNYNQGNTGHHPLSVAHQVRPPGFSPVQNNQNRGNNYNPGNSTYQASNQPTQAASSNELTNYMKIVKCLALANLGASINLMPLFIWRKLSLPELTPTQMILELADWSTTRPIDIAEDVFYSQEVLGFSDNSESSNPTPTSEPIIAKSSPSLTPFEGGDFILEEIEAYLASDSVLLGINDAEFDSEGDICLIKEMLNNDPYSPLPPKDLKCEELKSVNLVHYQKEMIILIVYCDASSSRVRSCTKMQREKDIANASRQLKPS
ncbi:retrotransposon protein, putative, ty1-copia subclass [Tanacetum coccineum]